MKTRVTLLQLLTLLTMFPISWAQDPLVIREDLKIRPFGDLKNQAVHPDRFKLKRDIFESLGGHQHGGGQKIEHDFAIAAADLLLRLEVSNWLKDSETLSALKKAWINREDIDGVNFLTSSRGSPFDQNGYAYFEQGQGLQILKEKWENLFLSGENTDLRIAHELFRMAEAQFGSEMELDLDGTPLLDENGKPKFRYDLNDNGNRLSVDKHNIQMLASFGVNLTQGKMSLECNNVISEASRFLNSGHPKDSFKVKDFPTSGEETTFSGEALFSQIKQSVSQKLNLALLPQLIKGQAVQSDARFSIEEISNRSEIGSPIFELSPKIESSNGHTLSSGYIFGPHNNYLRYTLSIPHAGNVINAFSDVSAWSPDGTLIKKVCRLILIGQTPSKPSRDQDESNLVLGPNYRNLSLTEKANFRTTNTDTKHNLNFEAEISPTVNIYFTEDGEILSYGNYIRD